VASSNSPSVAELISLFNCPCCEKDSLRWSFSNSVQHLPPEGSATCSGCQRNYPLSGGILDLLSSSAQEVITPFQRLMQFPPVTAVYEKYWRPLGFFIASSSSFRQFSADLMQKLEPRKQRIILDLACGPGLFACPLAVQTSGWVIGFDLSFPMLRQARRKAARLGILNLLLVRGSAFSLPFHDGAMDAILCSGALHLFDRPEEALAEISRTLARHGRFVCQTTIRPRHSAGLASFLDRVIRFGFFESAEDLNEKLLRAGLQVELAWRRRIIHAFQARRV
jgi:ubiquinone/menaquinone biosynthesis C-methylase UbiE